MDKIKMKKLVQSTGNGACVCVCIAFITVSAKGAATSLGAVRTRPDWVIKCS